MAINKVIYGGETLIRFFPALPPMTKEGSRSQVLVNMT